MEHFMTFVVLFWSLDVLVPIHCKKSDQNMGIHSYFPSYEQQYKFVKNDPFV